MALARAATPCPLVRRKKEQRTTYPYMVKQVDWKLTGNRKKIPLRAHSLEGHRHYRQVSNRETPPSTSRSHPTSTVRATPNWLAPHATWISSDLMPHACIDPSCQNKPIRPLPRTPTHPTSNSIHPRFHSLNLAGPQRSTPSTSRHRRRKNLHSRNRRTPILPQKSAPAPVR